MRNIKKRITTKTIVRYFYDRAAKDEKSDTVTVSEYQAAPELPENCILIECQTVSENETTYTMTPETFMKYATIDTGENADTGKA